MTSDKSSSDEPIPIDALNVVLAAMQPLDRQTRTRLFDAVALLIGYGRAQQAATPPPGPASNGADPTPAPTGFFETDRSQSPKHFIIEKRPRTDVDRIACLAYYLTHYRDQPQFKTVDLSALNSESAQLKFTNAARTVDDATRSGILIPAGAGQKQLSAAGELYVQRLPDYDAARQALQEHRQRSPRRR